MPPALTAFIPTALSAAGSVIGAVGDTKGNNNASPETAASGFNALPESVQKAWIETYMPKVLSQFANQTFQGVPMTRANTNPGIFDSQGLADLQRYNDASGGAFTAKSTPKDTTQQIDISTLPVDEQVMKTYGKTLADYIATERGDVTDQINRGITTAEGWWKNFGLPEATGKYKAPVATDSGSSGGGLTDLLKFGGLSGLAKGLF